MRDELLMFIMGSPNPYRQRIDGMSSATSPTSKTMIIATSAVPDHDVDYLYSQASIDSALVD